MAARHSDNDGSDIFWPGYVDAVTNLVLNLLFLLTIMTVAVFMFALELGRASRGAAEKPQAAMAKHDEGAGSPSTKAVDVAGENLALKQEVRRLTQLLEQQGGRLAKPGGQARAVDATAAVPAPEVGLDRTVAGPAEVVVRFRNDAVAFTAEEKKQLLDSLQPIVATGRAHLHIEVPAGFSEAKRLGFYRAMAVRNLLIEMRLAKESISISEVQGNSSADASLVRVRSR
ncbi:MAG: hypothetical protein FDZ69_11100 [Deltaproteobacteria bacterium]|nr:MAG: hypothetical protein FDZ69_11100 [Deltaproteobacteria bacterium]